MIELHSLPKSTSKKMRRVGRGYGSGAGAKSGRGTKRHQKAREKIKIWFEGGQNRMIKKFPLLRGKSKNKSVHTAPLILNLSDLNKLKGFTEISVATLVEKGIVRNDKIKGGIKILGHGELKQLLIVKLPVSKIARQKIEKSGGTIV